MSRVTRKQVMTWLTAHDFTERRGGSGTGHRKFTHPSGVAVTVSGHGPSNLSKKHVGMLMRQLERAGFDRERVREDLHIH